LNPKYNTVHPKGLQKTTRSIHVQSVQFNELVYELETKLQQRVINE